MECSREEGPDGAQGDIDIFPTGHVNVSSRDIARIWVELYLDDCIVYGATEEEFKANLRVIFERFQNHGITLNPKKCKFGLSSIEYVGHIIDQDGYDSRERRLIKYWILKHQWELRI